LHCCVCRINSKRVHARVNSGSKHHSLTDALRETISLFQPILQTDLANRSWSEASGPGSRCEARRARISAARPCLTAGNAHYRARSKYYGVKLHPSRRRASRTTLWTRGLICPSRCFCCDEMTGVLRMPEQKPIKVESGPGEPKVLKTPTGVRGVDIYQFPWVRDPRGDLTVGQFESEFPFLPKRYFIISGVPSDQIRGEHAHKQCHQFLICAYGQCSVTVDDGTTCLEVLLDKPSVGIYLPPMIWGKQWQYSADAALLVFASEPYDPSDYIREYEAFVKAARAPE
jgi:hypothetical protein